MGTARIIETWCQAWSDGSASPIRASRDLERDLLSGAHGLRVAISSARFTSLEPGVEHFSRWREDGMLEAVHDALREKVRVKEGHEPNPSGAIIDSQSGKTTQKGRFSPQTSKTAGTTLASISKLLLRVACFSRAVGAWTLPIVKGTDDSKGFVVLPRRWVVERTFGWLSQYRRLSKDYEENVKSSEAWIRLSMIHIMVRRAAP